MAMTEGSASAWERPLRIVVADDEDLALADILDCVAEVEPTARAAGFGNAMDALAWAREHPCDVALLDIEMPGVNGLELAGMLAEECPRCRIVFVTSYDDYALDAFGVHAQGYLLKPVDEDALARELAEARAWAGLSAAAPQTAPGASPEPGKPLAVTMFGGFEAFVGGERLIFTRARAKELLALLVDRRGQGMPMREAIACLWPDEPFSNSKRSYYQNLVSSLRVVLRAAGAEEVLVKSWNSLAVDPELIDCDLYRFLDGDPAAIASYRHDYLPQYEWAEYTVAKLDALLEGR